MKNSLSITKILLVGLLFLSMLSIGGLSTFAAGNYKDTAFEYSYMGDGSDASTDARSKLDTTSMWMNNIGSNTGYYATPFGTNSQNSVGVDCRYQNNVYYFEPQTKGYVLNLVKERGYSMARFVMMTSIHSGHIYLYGKWSPDSI